MNEHGTTNVPRRRLRPVLCAALLIAAASGSAWGAPAGTVAGTSGPCGLHDGDAVQVGQTVLTAPACNVKLQMADQSVILLAPDSSVTVTRYDVGPFGRTVTLNLTQGLLRLTVPPVPATSDFAVLTASGTAAMRSPAADWFVSVDIGAAQVGVLAGTVALTATVTQRSVAIPAHWGTRLEPGLDPMLPRAWAQVEFDGFIRRTACCQSTPPPNPKP